MEVKPEKKLLLLLWSMRYEWIACAVSCYFLIFGETFRELCYGLIGWVITWLLQFVRPNMYPEANPSQRS